jgi:DNA-binding MarR family transcriptional regulator
MNKSEFPQKEKHVYILYTLILRYIGENARYIAKSKLYSDVASFFYINPTSAGRIICRMEREGYSPTRFDMEDFMENVNKLNSIVSDIKSNY